MAERVRYMQTLESVSGQVLIAKTGAPWEVRLRGSATPVTFYTADTGGSGFNGTVANLATRNGRIEPASTPGGELWIESGTKYDEYTTANGQAVSGGNPLVKVGAGGALSPLLETRVAVTESHLVRKFPIEADYGIVLGAVRGTDVTASIAAARDAAVAAGGGVVTAATTGNASRYKFTGQIDFPDRVGFLGSGPRATLLEATTSGSFLNFEGNGPVSGNFHITGANLASKNIRVGLGDQRTFLPIRTESADIGLLLDQAQNHTFIGLHALNVKRGIVFDNGAGANIFIGHTEVSGFREWAVVFQHTGALSAPFDYPVYNEFYAGMLEHVVSGAVTGVASTDIFTKNAHGYLAGQRIAFRSITGGAGLSAGTPYYVINPTTNTFQVSTTLGGSAVDITTDLTVGAVAYAISGVVLDEAGGRGLKFIGTFLSASSATAPCSLVESHDPAGIDDKRLRFDSCEFVGDSARLYVTAFDLRDGTNVELGGRCTFHDLFRRFYMTDDSRARIESEPLIVNGAGTYFASNGGTKVASEVIRWENDLWGDLPGIVTPSGRDYPFGPTTVLLAAARGYFNRVKINRATPVAVVEFTTTVAATNNDNVEVAIFDSTGARIATSGNVAGKLNAAAGPQTVTLAQALEPGVYYVGLLCPAVGGTAATLVGSGAGGANALKTFGATAPKMLGCQQDGLGAGMPNPIVPAFASANLLTLTLREA